MAERDDAEDIDVVRLPGDVFEGKCDFCKYETTVQRYKSMAMLNGYERARPENKGRTMGHTDKDLCEVCASTPAGNALSYPEFTELNHVLRTIAYTTNMILNAIKDSKLS